jgi:hypothetical protein
VPRSAILRKLLPGIFLLALAALCLRWWNHRAPPPAPAPPPAADIIPPSIIVTEQSLPPPRAGGGSPGMHDIAGYAAPERGDHDDVKLLANSLTSFLAIHKQAGGRPLSANGEWSAALRGLRPGSTRWFDDSAPLFAADGRVIDRHGSPLHFHALGGMVWEIRSAGPDRRLFTDDDAVAKIPGG